MNSITKSFNEVFFLNSNSGTSPSYLALGKTDEFVLNKPDSKSFQHFQKWLDRSDDWVFGGISYDCKNIFENLESQHDDPIGFPLLHFVRPQVVIERKGEVVKILKNDSEFPDDRFHQMNWNLFEDDQAVENSAISLKPRISKTEYLQSVVELQKHIHHGDIYEVNFCQEFGTNQILPNPLHTWYKLNELTTAPFSCFVKLGHRYVLCASPERFLKKEGSTLKSQPIKGTIRRGRNDEEDNALKEQLYHSKKDRSENVMIVDLVRNDLSKHAESDSVKVTELFGVHTFRTVHHMISTIQSNVVAGTTFSQLLADTFPMGSMTGAPKIRAMQLIGEFESSRRGWYSGSIGYIAPNGDFDFNVVIRSIFYNEAVPYISYLAGGAITALSDPDDEYAESMLKAEALMKALM